MKKKVPGNESSPTCSVFSEGKAQKIIGHIAKKTKARGLGPTLKERNKSLVCIGGVYRCCSGIDNFTAERNMNCSRGGGG